MSRILATKIRNSTTIEGIQVASENGENNIKICQLADDTTLFLKNENAVRSSLTIIHDFGNHSGLKLNINKTDGMWLRRYKERNYN